MLATALAAAAKAIWKTPLSWPVVCGITVVLVVLVALMGFALMNAAGNGAH